jgi:TrmH family RNA methyltransferase
MGAVYDVNISYQDLEAFLNKQNAPIYGALLEGKSVYKTTLTQPAILVMGNEGNGIRKNIQKGITHPIMIPKIGVGESLNVATATAILLSEFVRMQ